eukprot:gb/GEZN01008203.1/.p1 GENE.gb/GEZN01008203.1/~~gb/GEZN01008203.1/.p1  ORF type:complete len:415 (+),score=78.98 gb/GEZN01008203.1/:187-1431(+)
MSSLKAARADNFYYPPEWDPSKGNMEQWEGLAPGHLGKRAKHQAIGVLVIRFELPFNCWCLHCKAHIAKGVRWNAEKSRVGQYFSTPIHEFKMFCHLCNGEIRIQTDPENNTYKMVMGLRKKHEEYSAKDAEAMELQSKEEKERMEKEAMFKLEVVGATTAKAKARAPELEQLYDLAEVHYDELESNSKLRKVLRARKAEDKLNAEAGAKLGLGFSLLPALDKDQHMAEAVLFAPRIDADRSAKLSRLKVTSESIFQTIPVVKTGDKNVKVSGNQKQQKARQAVYKAIKTGMKAQLRVHSGEPMLNLAQDRSLDSSSSGLAAATFTDVGSSSSSITLQGSGKSSTFTPPLMVVRKKHVKDENASKGKKAKKKHKKRHRDESSIDRRLSDTDGASQTLEIHTEPLLKILKKEELT